MARTYFFWDPLSDNILQERDETGAVTAEYTAEPGLHGNIISQNRGGVESQFHYDAQGSTLAVTDDNQNVTDTFAYTAFGEVTERTGTTEVPFQYIGRQGYYSDSLTGQIVARRRPYEAMRARWSSVDPCRHRLCNWPDSQSASCHDRSSLFAIPCDMHHEDNPVLVVCASADGFGIAFREATSNGYSYANSNPVACVDPSGLMVQSKCTATRIPFDALASVMCLDGKLVPVLIDIRKNPTTKENYSLCVQECLRTHEEVHVEQVNKLCPDWCKCKEHDKLSPEVPVPEGGQGVVECPAYRAERECLVRLLTARDLRCIRADLIERILEVDRIAISVFKCDPWRLPLP